MRLHIALCELRCHRIHGMRHNVALERLALAAQNNGYRPASPLRALVGRAEEFSDTFPQPHRSALAASSETPAYRIAR